MPLEGSGGRDHPDRVNGPLQLYHRAEGTGKGTTKIPGGMPGVETRGTLLYTYGVDAGRITKEKMCQLLSENPAKLYGMYPAKGAIAPGSDADIVVMRTGVEDMVTAADQVQNVDYAPFEGRKLTARIERVPARYPGGEGPSGGGGEGREVCEARKICAVISGE